MAAAARFEDVSTGLNLEQEDTFTTVNFTVDGFNEPETSMDCVTCSVLLNEHQEAELMKLRQIDNVLQEQNFIREYEHQELIKKFNVLASSFTECGYM